MIKDIKIGPPVIVAAVLCTICIMGFFFYRAFVAPHSYRGGLKVSEKTPILVQTPYGHMTAEQAAKAGLTDVAAQTGRSPSGTNK